MPYAHCFDGGKKVRLARLDPHDDGGLTKEKAAARVAALAGELNELDELLFAAGQDALLIVLQGLDTSGKDGTIRHLLNYVNVQSTRVAPFKVPTGAELRHDFLWRVHDKVPGRGEITVFNRSHYEDVLVVRVHGLVPEAQWRRRYDHINAFESLLADSHTIVLKFFLHISKEEQERRLLDREKDVTKAWKLAVGDWKERELWDRYTEAYEDALNRCATPDAPWYVVPADRKWFRNLAVTEAVVEALRPHKPAWLAYLNELGKTAKAELRAYRRAGRGAAGGAAAGAAAGGGKA